MDSPAKPKLQPKPGCVKVHRAIFPYEARTSDELSFDEGDILYVYDQSADGWWKAKCKGKTGLIPYNYVTEKDEVKHPLHDAARRGNLDFLQECLSQGVSSTGLDAMSNTPLYWAAHSGHIDCLQILLSQPYPPVNAQNHCGDTPLHVAANRGHVKAIEALLELGADVTIKNINGETAEDLAMDPAAKNVLHLNRPQRNSRPAAFDPEDYEDDSDT